VVAESLAIIPTTEIMQRMPATILSKTMPHIVARVILKNSFIARSVFEIFQCKDT